MKKAMWIISFLSLILTAIALQFMPDSVPMHYNLAGEIDRWGSKYENLVFPIIIIAIFLFWQLFVSYYEKKAAKSAIEKERVEAVRNAKVLKITGVSMATLSTAVQAFILYGAYVEANTDATHAHIDIMKVTCILVGAIILILGNFMPKQKRITQLV